MWLIEEKRLRLIGSSIRLAPLFGQFKLQTPFSNTTYWLQAEPGWSKKLNVLNSWTGIILKYFSLCSLIPCSVTLSPAHNFVIITTQPAGHSAPLSWPAVVMTTQGVTVFQWNQQNIKPHYVTDDLWSLHNLLFAAGRLVHRSRNTQVSDAKAASSSVIIISEQVTHASVGVIWTSAHSEYEKYHLPVWTCKTRLIGTRKPATS